MLKERRALPAGTLSGGQAQMLVLGRGLMSAPQLMLIDEPSLGLAPVMVQEVFAILERLKAVGCTIGTLRTKHVSVAARTDPAHVQGQESRRILIDFLSFKAAWEHHFKPRR
ncbi:ATP-binding cassette domain-containing protein [Paraburkholderia caffeinitolerans]|uniref:ATP-binding cassette domain-containing protein n=1 Tax=Paraburkholderia caffeinitolerans TaxID=1723730 RepID=UPI003CCD9043